MSLSVHTMFAEIRDWISLHTFNKLSMPNDLFATNLNTILEVNSRIKLTRRTSGKIILNVRPSSIESKVIVRYDDGTSSTMMIKNFLKNFNIIEIDEWDEDNEDREQDMLLMRLGIRV